MGEHPSGAVVVLNVPPASELLECGEYDVLKENLRAMVNNADYSDVQFVCSDGGRVHACRMLLVARSSVLKSLLTNGMSESKLTEIPLPDITTAAMLTVVEYLYTGMIISNKLTMVSVFQIVHASRFLMLDKLEKYVMHILVPAVKEVTDAELLVWCFTQFVEMRTEGEGIPDSVASQTSDLVRDMASKMEAMESHPLTRLSVPAMNFYLDATQSKSITVSLKAYLRLRSILLWAGGRVSLLAEDVLRGCLPDEKCLREAFHAWRGHRKHFGNGRNVSRFEPGVKQQVEKWVKKLDLGWSRVMFQCIHPQLLVQVLEPLDLIPQSLFVSAWRHQALNARGMNVMKWYNHTKRCTIEENGLVFQCDGEAGGKFRSAYANMAMNHGLCEWEITVETPCKHLSIVLDENRYGCRDRTRRLKREGIVVHGESPPVSYGKAFGHKGSKVRVHLDMKLRTCAFTIDGKRFGVAWSNLPHELYAGVWLKKGGRVRLQLVSDPDFI